MEEQIFQKRRKAKKKDFVDYSSAMEEHSCLVVAEEEAELRDDELGVVQLILSELLLQKVAAVRLA